MGEKIQKNGYNSDVVVERIIKIGDVDFGDDKFFFIVCYFGNFLRSFDDLSL